MSNQVVLITGGVITGATLPVGGGLSASGGILLPPEPVSAGPAETH